MESVGIEPRYVQLPLDHASEQSLGVLFVAIE